jgi:hypothetical protein
VGSGRATTTYDAQRLAELGTPHSAMPLRAGHSARSTDTSSWATPAPDSDTWDLAGTGRTLSGLPKIMSRRLPDFRGWPAETSAGRNGVVLLRDEGAGQLPAAVVKSKKRGGSGRSRAARRFVALSKAAGLRQVRLHDLRHGAASLMLAAGVPMAIVSKMLRHSSIGITVDTYGHLSEETARTASDAIGALLDAAFEKAANTVANAARDHTATTAAAGDATSGTGQAAEGTQDQLKTGGPRGDRTHNPRIKSSDNTLF